MVRGVSSFNSICKAKGVLLGNKPNVAKNIASKVSLPSKIMLSSVGMFGVANVVQEPKSQDAFVMKCSEYDSSEPIDCEWPYDFAHSV